MAGRMPSHACAKIRTPVSELDRAARVGAGAQFYSSRTVSSSRPDVPIGPMRASASFVSASWAARS